MIRNRNITYRKATQQEVKNRASDYVCVDCGRPFIPEHKRDSQIQNTFYQGTCGLCRKEKSITHIRAFNWLQNFTT